MNIASPYLDGTAQAHPAAIAPVTEPDVTRAFLRGPHQRLDVGHSRLAYWRFGTGPDVVLVHGWPLHGATFRRVIPYLAPEFTVHVVDLPGTGRTESVDHAPLDVLSHAATVRRAVDALALSRYAFLAHDSGGTIARMVAADDKRVAGLVLTNTEIPGDHPAAITRVVRLGRLPLAHFWLFPLVGARRLRRLALGRCFTDPAYVDGEFGELFLRPLTASSRAAAGQLGMIRSFDFGIIDRLSDVHARIQAPVLCVWGTKDRFFPAAKARAMLTQFSACRAELVEIAEASTFLHEDHAPELSEHAIPFLRRCTSPDVAKERSGV